MGEGRLRVALALETEPFDAADLVERVVESLVRLWLEGELSPRRLEGRRAPAALPARLRSYASAQSRERRLTVRLIYAALSQDRVRALCDVAPRYGAEC
jgi:hypothetical protein